MEILPPNLPQHPSHTPPNSISRWREPQMYVSEEKLITPIKSSSTFFLRQSMQQCYPFCLEFFSLHYFMLKPYSPLRSHLE